MKQEPDHWVGRAVLVTLAAVAVAVLAILGLINLSHTSDEVNSQAYQTGYVDLGPHAAEWARVMLPPTSWESPDWSSPQWNLSDTQECDGAAQYWLIDWGTNHDNEPSWWDPATVRNGCLAYLEKK